MSKFQNVIIGQKAFILNEESKLLILRRKKVDIFTDLWDVPGGKLKDGDSLFSGLAREVMEETKMKLEEIILILSSSKFMGQVEDSSVIIRNIYLCRASGKLKMSGEHSEFKWIDPKEIEAYEFPPDEDFQYVVKNIAEKISQLDLSLIYSKIF